VKSASSTGHLPLDCSLPDSPERHTGFSSAALTATVVQVAAHQIAERRLIMDLVQFVLVLIVIGVLLWMVNNFIPMDRKIRQILNIVVVIAVILWVLNLFGLFSSLHGIRIGR